MQKNTHLHSGQIGIIAVILTTVLLVIGISVAARVTQQSAQNVQRTESTQALNQAEGGLEEKSDETTITSTIVGDDSILLSQGETVEILIDEEVNNLNLDLKWQKIGTNGDLCTNSDHDNTPALLIARYHTISDGTNQSTSVDYYPVQAYNRSAETGYTASEQSSDPEYNSLITAAKLAGTQFQSGDTVRVKALVCNVTISMPGLVTITRSVSQDNSGQQVRVIEQRQTKPAAPSIMDYALFAGNGDLNANQ